VVRGRSTPTEAYPPRRRTTRSTDATARDPYTVHRCAPAVYPRRVCLSSSTDRSVPSRDR